MQIIKVKIYKKINPTENIWESNQSNRRNKKNLILLYVCDTIFWRMEVGFFFMPKNATVSQTVK